MGSGDERLIACHDCDTLHRRVALRAHEEAHCSRCGARLYRRQGVTPAQALPLVLAALIVFAIANSQPLMTLDMQGQRHSAILLDAVRTLMDEGLAPAALVVLGTVIVLPLVELLLLGSILLTLRSGYRPPELQVLMRWLLHIRPWVMMDVLLMALLVALVKLVHSVSVIPGISLWAYAALAFLMAALATLDPRALWAQLDVPAAEAAE